MINLYQGNCLEIMKQINDSSVDCIITDPPYFVLPNGKHNDKFKWDDFGSLDQFIVFFKGVVRFSL